MSGAARGGQIRIRRPDQGDVSTGGLLTPVSPKACTARFKSRAAGITPIT